VNPNTVVMDDGNVYFVTPFTPEQGETWAAEDLRRMVRGEDLDPERLVIDQVFAGKAGHLLMLGHAPADEDDEPGISPWVVTLIVFVVAFVVSAVVSYLCRGLLS
jgi:hypothetical protein